MIGIRAKRIISDTVIYIVLTIMVCIWLFPLVWLILRSFDANSSVYTTEIFPSQYTFEAYEKLFTDKNFPYGRWILNTFVVAIASCIICTLFVLMVSYALSRLRFKMRKKLMNIALILGLFPGFMSIIALYYIFDQFKLTDSLVGLVLVYSLGSGTGYYIVKGFFDTIPFAIDEAARIDGASKNRIFWQMIIPLSKPIIIYTILTSFLGPWCDFITANVFISSDKNLTVAVGLRKFITGLEYPQKYYTRFCAGGVLIAIPIVILYLIMQKFYVAGITGGAAKG